MIHNIIDVNGNTIGTLELPDSYTSDQVAAALAIYTYVPPAPTTQQRVSSAIQSSIDFGNALMLEFSTDNVLKGITQAGQTQAVANYLANLLNYISSGSMYAAITEINNLIADTSTTKQNLSPFITNDVLYAYLNKIQAFLNLPLTANPGSGS